MGETARSQLMTASTLVDDTQLVAIEMSVGCIYEIPSLYKLAKILRPAIEKIAAAQEKRIELDGPPCPEFDRAGNTVAFVGVAVEAEPLDSHMVEDGAQTSLMSARAVCIHLARAEDETDAEQDAFEAEAASTELVACVVYDAEVLTTGEDWASWVPDHEKPSHLRRI